MNSRPFQTAWLLAIAISLIAATGERAIRAEDCQGNAAVPSSCGHTCHRCTTCCRHKCHHKCCCCEPPHGVVLPSAPALYFGASTLSVVPAGFHQPPAFPQGYGANRPPSDCELLALLKLLQAQQAQGISPQGAGCERSALGGAASPGAQGLGSQGIGAAGTIESRLAEVESQIQDLRSRVDEHTTALAEIYARDPALQKKLRVEPGR